MSNDYSYFVIAPLVVSCKSRKMEGFEDAAVNGVVDGQTARQAAESLRRVADALASRSAFTWIGRNEATQRPTLAETELAASAMEEQVRQRLGLPRHPPGRYRAPMERRGSVGVPSFFNLSSLVGRYRGTCTSYSRSTTTS